MQNSKTPNGTECIKNVDINIDDIIRTCARGKWQNTFAESLLAEGFIYNDENKKLAASMDTWITRIQKKFINSKYHIYYGILDNSGNFGYYLYYQP